MAIGGSPQKLDFTPRDVGMVVVDVVLAMATKEMLIKQRLIPAVTYNTIFVINIIIYTCLQHSNVLCV